MQEEYGVVFALSVGALLYFSHTRPAITLAVIKFAKFTQHPGGAHVETLLHLLRCLRGNRYLGLKFYSDINLSLITCLLSSNGIAFDNPSFTYTDYS